MSLEDKNEDKGKEAAEVTDKKEIIELREVSEPDDVSSIDQETSTERKFRRFLEGVRHLGAFGILCSIVVICASIILFGGEGLNQLKQTALTLLVTIGGGASTLLFNKKD